MFSPVGGHWHDSRKDIISTFSQWFRVCVFPGNYSCLVAEFHLHRSIGFHLIQSYLPSILIVAISWVSFWMDVDCVPARVTLGVITLLTVSSQVSGMLIWKFVFPAKENKDSTRQNLRTRG